MTKESQAGSLPHKTGSTMIVTIDGPAGAGKSTVARSLAQRLGFRYLDTGAMYRAVALALLQAGVDDEGDEQLVDVANRADVNIDGDRVFLNGNDVTAQIRTPEVTAKIYLAADNPAVRDRMVQLQRQLAAGGQIVCDGRDQGTVAFADAPCKIFLTASPEERARRRWAELHDRGSAVTQNEVLNDQNERDKRDQTRPVGALKKADDAIEVVTDGMTLEEVVERLAALVAEKQA